MTNVTSRSPELGHPLIASAVTNEDSEPVQREAAAVSVFGVRLLRVDDHLLEVCACVALLACELDQFGDLAPNLTLRWGSDDPDAAAGAHLEQPFIA